MRIRRDTSARQPDGAIVWRAQWMGGPSLAAVENCRIDLAGDMRRTVEATGDADTFFSIPATTRIGGCHVRGFLSNDDDGNLVFHCCRY